MTLTCPTCNAPWTDHGGISGPCDEIRRLKSERCDHCGSDHIYSGPPDCPRCGAPNCCQVCCQMQCLEDEVQRLRDERDMYRKLFESALGNVDRVFQLCQENPEPILPDFAIAGENRFRAVVRLAEDYKRLRSRLAAIREKLEQIVCVKEPDAGVVLLSSESPMHETIIDGERYQTYSMDHFSPLGDALIEVWQLTQEQP